MQTRNVVQNVVQILVVAAAVACVTSSVAKAAPRPKLNLLFVLIDDLGWNDVGYNGSTFHDTPRVDRFATQAMRFDWAYAPSPMCSPTRTSILTGKNPGRHGITQYIPGWRCSKFRVVTPVTGQYLGREEITVGEAFREAGYTTAFMGKWHMGDLDRGGPKAHGYDVEKAIIETNRCTMFHPFRGVKFDDAKEGDYIKEKYKDRIRQ